MAKPVKNRFNSLVFLSTEVFSKRRKTCALWRETKVSTALLSRAAGNAVVPVKCLTVSLGWRAVFKITGHTHILKRAFPRFKESNSVHWTLFVPSNRGASVTGTQGLCLTHVLKTDSDWDLYRWWQNQSQQQTAPLDWCFVVHKAFEGCTVPSNTAIPGRCVEWTEQAPFSSPKAKNLLNKISSYRGHIRY